LSFALFNYLKEKYTDIDKARSKKTSTSVVRYSGAGKGGLLKQAS
jgi:hypothetical protein